MAESFDVSCLDTGSANFIDSNLLLNVTLGGVDLGVALQHEPQAQDSPVLPGRVLNWLTFHAEAIGSEAVSRQRVNVAQMLLDESGVPLPPDYFTYIRCTNVHAALEGLAVWTRVAARNLAA